MSAGWVQGEAPHPERLADAVGVHPGRHVLYVVPHQVWRQVARILHHLCTPIIMS